MSKTQVATKKPEAKSTDIVTTKQSLPANATAAFDSGPTGFENVTSSDLIIPRLTILQGLSPQVTQGKPEFDPNARVGMIYDVGLQEGFDGGIDFLPVFYTKNWIEWAPRNSGKGLVEIHTSDAILDKTEKDDRGRDVMPNGNYIAETAQLFGFNMTANRRRSFIPMASTQLKKAKRLLTLATAEEVERADGSKFTPPLWYRVYHFTTVPESNNEGNWMGWKIERGPSMPELPGWEKLLADVKVFRDSVAKGQVRGDLDQPEDRAVPDENAPM